MPNIVFFKVPPDWGDVEAGAVGAVSLPVTCVRARLCTGSPAVGTTPKLPPHAVHCFTLGDCGVPQCGQGTMLTVTGIAQAPEGEAKDCPNVQCEQYESFVAGGPPQDLARTPGFLRAIPSPVQCLCPKCPS